MQCIRPGKPVENAYCESFNGNFRDECLNSCWFTTRCARTRLFYIVVRRQWQIVACANV
ncbi:MAG: transposase [Gemmatimonadaceae bacterium]|nr:transposase [Gemmatimonadaceae bacterium]